MEIDSCRLNREQSRRSNWLYTPGFGSGIMLRLSLWQQTRLSVLKAELKPFVFGELRDRLAASLQKSVLVNLKQSDSTFWDCKLRCCTTENSKDRWRFSNVRPSLKLLWVRTNSPFLQAGRLSFHWPLKNSITVFVKAQFKSCWLMKLAFNNFGF